MKVGSLASGVQTPARAAAALPNEIAMISALNVFLFIIAP